LPRLDGLSEIIEKIDPNAYKVDLPSEYGVFVTFDVADPSPYVDEQDDLPSLRSNSKQARGDGGDHPSNDQTTSKEDGEAPRELRKFKPWSEAS